MPLSAEELRLRKREESRRYRERNREKLNEEGRLYYAANREKMIARSNAYQVENWDSIKERRRARAREMRELAALSCSESSAEITTEELAKRQDAARRLRETREKHRESCRRYCVGNRQKCREAVNRHADANREKIREKNRVYYSRSIDFLRERRRNQERERKGRKPLTKVTAELKDIETMGLPQLQRLLAGDASALRNVSNNLGRRQRHLLAWLCSERDEILSEHPSLAAELDRMGQPLVLEGGGSFRSTVRVALVSLERRGMLMRQNIMGCPTTGKPRTRPADPIDRVTHVQMLPAGIIVGTRLLTRVKAKEKLHDWESLKAEERTAVVLDIIEWRSRHGHGGGQQNKDIANLTECLRTGENPLVKLPHLATFGSEEITWQSIPKKLDREHLIAYEIYQRENALLRWKNKGARIIAITTKQSVDTVPGLPKKSRSS